MALGLIHKIYLLMKEGCINSHLRRPRRNYSDFEPKLSYLKNLQEILEEEKTVRTKLTSIKINRNKLPADFFPRSETVRKKVSTTRTSIENGINLQRQLRTKQSEQSNMSPEKTSFFRFIQQQHKEIKMPYANTLSIKRQFESRNEPKRQKIYFEQRNFTPSTGTHRNDALLMFPDNYEESIAQALKLSKKKTLRQLGGKDCKLRKKQLEKLIQQEEAEQESNKVENAKEMNISTSGGSEDMHNITFYNAKSTSFPPINKNHNS